MGFNLKETVDAYLIKHYKDIEEVRGTKDFRWSNIAYSIDRDLEGEYVRNRYIKIRKNVGTTPSNLGKNTTVDISQGIHLVSGNENKDKGTKEFTFTASNIPTEEEIITHFNIDTTKYKISQIWHKTTPGGKYSISVNLQALKGMDGLNYEKEFKSFIDNHNLTIFKKATKVVYEEDKNNVFEKDCTVIINLADLHLGKLVSEAETGERYNIEIAKERFLTCIKYFATKAYQCYGVKKFILSTLGDTLHTDSLKSTTTAGTYVESDTRASKTFQTALELITQSIDILKEYAPSVEFININGNHCELSEQHLGIAIKAYYRNDKQVIINAEPKNRKYSMIGQNLLTWNHGDTNMNTLPLTVATEVPELWGQSKFRLIQLGHFHSTKKKVFQSEDEFNGVIVRHFSSLSGTDFWHDKNNFRGSQKRGTALVFSDKEVGIIGELYKTV